MCLVPDIDWENPIRSEVIRRDLTLADFTGIGGINPITPFVGYVRFEFPETVKYPCIPINVDGIPQYPLTSEGMDGVYVAGPFVWLALRLGAHVYCDRGYFLNVRYVKDFSQESRSLATAVKQLVVDRNLAKHAKGKGSLEELILKTMVNSGYGKNAQNVVQKTAWTALKDLINKPFADFQAVALNEGTSIEEMERVPEATQTSHLASGGDTDPDESEPEVAAQPVQAFTPVSEPEQEATPEPVAEPEPVPVSVPEQKDEPITPSEEKKGSHLWAWVLGLLLLCLLAFLAYKFLGKPSVKVEEPVQPQVETPVEEAPAPEPEFAQVPDGEYKIVGTLKTYVMKPGDYLAKIAREEYGDKEFAKYIIAHNAFTDPDSIPVNMEIKLPELMKIE